MPTRILHHLSLTHHYILWILTILGFFTLVNISCDKNTGTSLRSIKIEPNQLFIANGKTQNLKAFGNFTDGSKKDLSDTVTWSSSDTNIAVIGRTNGNKKHVKSVQEGSVTIIATSNVGISGTAKLKVTPSELVSLAVTPMDLSVHLGHIQQFTATGTYSDGKQKEITSKVNWSTSNTSLPIISNTSGSKGLAISPPAGTITIIANDPNTHITGTSTLTVTTTKLVSVAVGPKDSSVPLGHDQVFSAIGTYVDGSTNDITTSVIWTVSDPSVAGIKKDPFGKGIITSISAGKTSVKATDPTIIISGSTSLIVTPPSLVSILTTPSEPSVYLGNVQSLSATGIYSNNSKKKITGSVIFTSSDPSIAIISKAEDLNTSLIPISPGSTKIKALDPQTGISSITQLTIIEPELVSITIKPSNPKILLGNNRIFTAMGTFTDGKIKNITNKVTWSTSKPLVTKISNNKKIKGLAISSQKGSAEISAVDPATGISGKTVFYTSKPKLISISISPSAPPVSAGDTLIFTATGKYNNGKTKDITNQVHWFASKPAMMEMDNPEGPKGLVRFLSPGSVFIKAIAPGDNITGKTSFTINTAKLISITISPASISIPLGHVQPVFATGTFSDKTTKDITKSVDFSSSDPSVVTLDSTSGSGTSLITISPGTAVIQAIDQDTKIKSSFQVEITPSKLISIAISPANPSISLSRCQRFTAIGVFSDGNRIDMSASVRWKSSEPQIARISNVKRKIGRATSLSEGSTIIRAVDPDTGISGETILTSKTFRGLGKKE